MEGQPRSSDARALRGRRAALGCELEGAAGGCASGSTRSASARARPGPAPPADSRCGALAGAAAAVVLAVVLALPGGAGGPTVVEAAELGTLPATEPAPRPGGPKLLDASASACRSPTGPRSSAGSRAAGAWTRSTGAAAVTVFYEKGAQDRVHDRHGGLAPGRRALGKRAARGHAAPLRGERRPAVVTWSAAGAPASSAERAWPRPRCSSWRAGRGSARCRSEPAGD